MPASEEVLAAARQIIEAGAWERVLAACRAEQPDRARDCLAERLRARRELLLEMREYVEGCPQSGCYAECALRRHEVYRQHDCLQACQRRGAAELADRLADFRRRMRALSGAGL